MQEVKRRIPPFKDQLVVPVGFVLPDEDLDEAALRELREETGVTDVYLEQLYSFGDPKRDPRGRIVSIGGPGPRALRPYPEHRCGVQLYGGSRFTRELLKCH